ncbi:MAG: right-handed parallel beta-helix repeat-containing protein [Phycisphaerae bacterium]|nr:right-handed parallel beta-helix repeat-containing protein [Phycisphaerae bacterium]
MKKHIFNTLCLLSIITLVLSSSICLGDVITVNKTGTGDYSSIQTAIDAAGSGDTIMVAQGYYQENITLKSNVNLFGDGYEHTWLRGIGTDHVVTAIDVTNAQIDGFAIYNNQSDSENNGLYISGGSVTVSNNWIIGNEKGIYIVGKNSSVIRNNLIYGNGNSESSVLDYGIIVLHSTPLITNNLIRDNEGVGIYMAWSDSAGARIVNNTIVNNESNGIWCYECSGVIIKNNILTGNSTGISASHTSVPIISYNNVWGNNWKDYDSQSGGVANPGPGDISEDPMFITSNSDYYLDEDSPCIDAGDPDPIYNDKDDSRNDMGWHGGPDGDAANRYGIMSGFIFTSIGKIPVSEIDTTGDSIGLANITSQTASDLSIYKYTDAPFGGNLWIHGLFGPEDSSVYYYQILVARWTTIRPTVKSAVPLTDSLSKTYYTIQSDGTVKATRYECGPKNIFGLTGLYRRTHENYWTHPDLKMIWRTTGWENGKYTIFYKAYNAAGTPVSLPDNDQNSMTIIVNNTNVEAEIIDVKQNNGITIPECGMIELASDTENVKFVVKARHPNGYLRGYTLNALYGTNRDAGDVVNEQYVGEHDGSAPYWYGVTSTTYNSSAAMTEGILQPWHTCAHQFRLNVYARTTNGYNHVYWKQFNDHYYVKADDCSWCNGADINRDKIVNLLDFEILAQNWLATCQSGCQ